MALTHLVDTSVLKRLGRPAVRQVVEPLAAAGRLARPRICDLEVGFSARTEDEWSLLTGALEAFEAVETTAGDMPSEWVIHAATMRLGGPTSEDIIRRATASTLAKADQLGARSLALVAFGTGVGGFPLEDAARVEIEEVRRHLEGDTQLERVVFAVHGEAAKAAFDAALGP